MRDEITRYGTRVHYSASEAPGLIEQAGEMFWEPYAGWIAWLRRTERPGAPYELQFRVRWRYVFRGEDHDVSRLLAEFQAFLDRNVDRVDAPGFRCHNYAPPRGR